MTRAGRRCIFCGDGGLSREHVWPAWAAKYLPDMAHAVMAGLELTPDSFVSPRERLRTMQGSTKNLTVKAVCRRCNNGWMGRLEEAAKPAVTVLLTRDGSAISADQAAPLRRWIFMKSACLDHARFIESVFDPASLVAFRAGGDLPTNFQAWIYRNDTDAWCAALRMLTFVAVQPGEPVYEACNARLMLWGLGSSTILVSWSPIHGGRPVANVEDGADIVIKLVPGEGELNLPTRGLQEGDHDKLVSGLLGAIRPRPDVPAPKWKLV